MHADVCGIPFVQTVENEAPMLGSAVLVSGHHRLHTAGPPSAGLLLLGWAQSSSAAAVEPIVKAKQDTRGALLP